MIRCTIPWFQPRPHERLARNHQQWIILPACSMSSRQVLLIAALFDAASGANQLQCPAHARSSLQGLHYEIWKYCQSTSRVQA